MNNIKFWIALEQSPGMGPVHLKEVYTALAELNLSIIDIFDLTDDEIEQEFNFHSKVLEAITHSKKILQTVEKDYFTLLDRGIDIIPFFSSEYPARLKETMGNAHPPLLYTCGNKTLLNNKGIAILGDKNVSSKGELISYMGAKQLSRHNVVTISGFAAGVDIIAHRAALETNGYTIAVLPYGIDHLVVPEFIKDVLNMDRIVFLSTFYPTKEANKYNAFIRNKTVCALSYGVYIIEAPAEGGVFEAAKSANKLEIPLFTTEYSEFPENAPGNKKILDDMGGIAIRGRLEEEMLVPNMDKIISLAKF
ncbi:MAG: hypothetical protein GY754_36970 [bacterium]|nr:hypothetical protein [bacterium]